MLTIKEIAEKSGRSYNSVNKMLNRYGIKPVVETKPGKPDLYDDSTVDFLSERHARRARPKKYHAEKAGNRQPAVMYKVSVCNIYHNYVVKACCLKYSDAVMISQELKALGIKARFKPHSFGVKSAV